MAAPPPRGASGAWPRLGGGASRLRLEGNFGPVFIACVKHTRRARRRMAEQVSSRRAQRATDQGQMMESEGGVGVRAWIFGERRFDSVNRASPKEEKAAREGGLFT